jgi:beta-glucanase (GH16 family)
MLLLSDWPVLPEAFCCWYLNPFAVAFLRNYELWATPGRLFYLLIKFFKTMKKISTIIALFVFGLCQMSSAQWNLVWQDEFNGSINPDWVFETGTGDWGWGNNEQQYYRRENISVVNGALQIQAKREDYGGMRYTSGRMKTQGRKSFKYGKIEARISIPSFNGVWPAFWMLGSNITSVGWPACGEIDIMEHVNTGDEIHGTVHWDSGGHATYGGSTSTSVTDYHVYSIEWNEQYIRWFVDGVQYHEVNIENAANSTEEFHNDFFIILNMAIGGEWPGYNIDEGAMPANMLVDYVRVYEESEGGDDGTVESPFIEAENYAMMSGVETETCSDEYGGLNVGWIDAGDWMLYDVTVPQTGVYEVSFRVASPNSNGIIQMEQAGGGTVFGTVNVPNTGGWQNWQTVSLSATLNAGAQQIAVVAPVGGYNLNWLEVSAEPFVPTNIAVEAEDYTMMNGIDLEACSDVGGGQNVGWIDTGDWMVWDVDIPEAGSYVVSYRVASPNSTGVIQLEQAGGGTVFGTVNVPGTGGWQTWQTVDHTVNLNAGAQQIAIYAAGGGFNINWFQIGNGLKSAVNAAAPFEADLSKNNIEYSFARNVLNVSGLSESSQVEIFDVQGRSIVKRTTGGNAVSINVSGFNSGIYIVKVLSNKDSKVFKFLKQ